MTGILKKAWTEVVDPFFRRPKRVQVAALCYRKTETGKEFLLITSMSNGRWIIPKGWPIDGKDASGAAKQEAWEEAGVEAGKVANDAFGSYDYTKQLETGGEATCETQVFPIEVTKLADKFPESELRERKWVPQKEAAEMVQEPQLQDILRRF